MAKRAHWDEAVDRKSILDNKGFQQSYQVSKRGVKKGTKFSFEKATRTEEPRTPFEALRFKLKLKQCEWAEILQTSQANLGAIDRGTVAAGVPLAKRMQEEAWKRGEVVTLDELYQHVVPWRLPVEEN